MTAQLKVEDLIASLDQCRFKGSFALSPRSAVLGEPMDQKHPCMRFSIERKQTPQGEWLVGVRVLQFLSARPQPLTAMNMLKDLSIIEA